MGRFTYNLIRLVRSWETPACIAFLLALGLLIAAFCALTVGPSSLRQPAFIGFIGLLFAAQVIFMWANRYMVTPYSQAQRAYLAEDFATARQILESRRQSGQADPAALTLLANTYRQLGLLNESLEIVKEAIEIRPFDPFSLYGFGRTLLVMGRYAEAVDAFRQAVEAGAVSVVYVDLGEACYRQAMLDEARAALENTQGVHDSARLLMVAYLRYRLGADEMLPASDLIRAGLAYWRDHAERYHSTPYGQALADDVQQMQLLLEQMEGT